MENQLYTITEVAEILSVSITQVYRYTHQKRNPLPVVYLGESSPRITKDALEAWISEQIKK